MGHVTPYRPYHIFISNSISTNNISTNGISTSASICCGIKPGYISPGKRYSFFFASDATAAIATATAAARARAQVAARILYVPYGKVHTGLLARVD